VVHRAASPSHAAPDGPRRRRQRVGAALQPRLADRALQHARHAQSAAHRAPDQGLRAVLRHGSHPVLDHRRHAGLARHRERDLRRDQRAGQVRQRALPRASQRVRAQCAGSAAHGAVQVGHGPARLGAEPQPLHQGGRGRRGQAAVRLGPLVLCTCPHPLDPSPSYAPKKLGIQILEAVAPGPDDLCRRSRPENERGFQNTERVFL
jgi:hypothetical protein